MSRMFPLRVELALRIPVSQSSTVEYGCLVAHDVMLNEPLWSEAEGILFPKSYRAFPACPFFSSATSNVCQGVSRSYSDTAPVAIRQLSQMATASYACPLCRDSLDSFVTHGRSDEDHDRCALHGGRGPGKSR